MEDMVHGEITPSVQSLVVLEPRLDADSVIVQHLEMAVWIVSGQPPALEGAGNHHVIPQFQVRKAVLVKKPQKIL